MISFLSPSKGRTVPTTKPQLQKSQQAPWMGVMDYQVVPLFSYGVDKVGKFAEILRFGINHGVYLMDGTFSTHGQVYSVMSDWRGLPREIERLEQDAARSPLFQFQPPRVLPRTRPQTMFNARNMHHHMWALMEEEGQLARIAAGISYEGVNVSYLRAARISITDGAEVLGAYLQMEVTSEGDTREKLTSNLRALEQEYDIALYGPFTTRDTFRKNRPGWADLLHADSVSAVPGRRSWAHRLLNRAAQVTF